MVEEFLEQLFASKCLWKSALQLEYHTMKRLILVLHPA
jgi:hypothetical protein